MENKIKDGFVVTDEFALGEILVIPVTGVGQIEINEVKYDLEFNIDCGDIEEGSIQIERNVSVAEQEELRIKYQDEHSTAWREAYRKLLNDVPDFTDEELYDMCQPFDIWENTGMDLEY